MPDQIAKGRRYRDQSQAERLAARRAQIIEAALELFSEKGYRAASIEELCSRARVSTRNFYENFADREALLLTLHDDLNARALEAVGVAVAETPPDDLLARALAGVKAYFDIVTSDPRWARIALVDTVGVSPTTERHRQEAIARFASLLEAEADRMAAQGLIPKRESYALQSVALVGAINGLANTWTSTPDWADKVGEVVEVAARLIVAGLAQDAPSLGLP